MAAEPMYKKGSLAALRAERAKAKQQQNEANNVIFDSKPTTPSTPNNNDNNNNNLKIDSNAEKIDNNNSLKVNSNGNASNHDTENSGYMDQWGFVLSEEQKQAKLKEIGTDQHRAALRKQNDRIHKWLHMLDSNHWETFNTTKKAKLKSRIRKGIPAPLRAKVWKKLLGVEELTKEERAYYSKIRYQEPPAKFKGSIDNDLDRTFPRHILFQKHNKSSSTITNGKESPTNTKSGRGKDSLKNVLYAYANHDSDVGYTQGMGFIAALFLMLMTEDDAFWCLCKLFDQNGDFQMRGLYLDGLPLLHCRYYQFNQLLLKFMPKVYEHINTTFKINPALYASKWFITIFCYEFPFDFVYRIWDVYLHEGIKFVFRIALALIKVNEAQILKIDQFDEMMKYLQTLHNQITSIDYLLTKAFDLPLKHEHLQVAEEAYNRKKLADDRERRHHGGKGGRSRGGRRARDDDMAAMQEIVKRKSATPNLSPNGLTPTGNYTPSSNYSSPDTENEQDLNNMYKLQVSKDNDKKNQVPDMVNIDKSDDELNKKEVIMEDEETDQNHDNEEKKQDEGSHSENSLVDEEPSSLLPNGHHEHEPIPPNDNDNNNKSNGHSGNNGNTKIENGQNDHGYIE